MYNSICLNNVLCYSTQDCKKNYWVNLCVCVTQQNIVKQ